MTDAPHTPAQTDGCPAWADLMIRQILDLEVRLGNLRPAKDAWARTQMDDVWQRVYGDADETQAQEGRVEALFRQIVHRLAAEGHDAPAIAAFVNARVRDAGGLPYCNAQEVIEALRSGLS